MLYPYRSHVFPLSTGTSLARFDPDRSLPRAFNAPRGSGNPGRLLNATGINRVCTLKLSITEMAGWFKQLTINGLVR